MSSSLLMLSTALFRSFIEFSSNRSLAVVTQAGANPEIHNWGERPS